VVILIAATVAGALWFSSQNPGGSAQPIGEPANSPPPFAAEPTGCLVPGQDLQMLLATQKQAPHTTTGAVEFSAALLRWLYQYPNPTAKDSAVAQPKVVASTSPFDLVETFSGNPNTSNSLVPNDTDFYLTTTISKYLVESYTDGSASVTVNGVVHVNGALNPQLVIATTYALIWEQNAWRVVSSSRPEPGRLASVGKAFTGGC